MIVHAYISGPRGTIGLCGNEVTSSDVCAEQFDEQIKVNCPHCRMALDRLAMDYQRRMRNAASSPEGQG